MARLPFDPDKARGAPAPPSESRYGGIEEADQLTVSQLSSLIKQTLEQRIASPLRVVGEISNLNQRQHWYFSLKDEDAVVSCVAWASSARTFGFDPEVGDKVLATGHVSHYAPQGRTQFYVSNLEPVGAGELERRFRALCAELRGEGYFDESAKQPLPPFPRRIAVITSATGAALQDVIATTAHRCPAVGLTVVDVRVQGEGAAEQVAAAIARVDADHARLGVDAILVTRGGGSIEDLWAFNERVVADAIFRCRLPIVAAIGHESDLTVAELVADLRAATPTQAAMRLVPDATELHRQVDHLASRLHLLHRRRLERARERLESLARHESFRRPEAVLVPLRDRLDHFEAQLHLLQRRRLEQARERLAALAQHLHRTARYRLDRRGDLERFRVGLDRAVRHRLARQADHLGQLERRLRAVDPTEVLRRGFSYTTDGAGDLVRSTGDVTDGDVLVTHLVDGEVRSTVGDGRPARGRGKRRDGGRPQMDLFDRPE